MSVGFIFLVIYVPYTVPQLCNHRSHWDFCVLLVEMQTNTSIALNLPLPRGQAGEGSRGVVRKIQTITENNQEQLATLLLHIRQVLGDSAPLHFQASAAVTLNYFQ